MTIPQSTLEYFITPPKNSVPFSCHSPFPHKVPDPWQPYFPSVSQDLPSLDFSYKWNHTICDLLHLASFNYHNIFQVYPFCNMYQDFISFYWEIIFYYMNVPHFIYAHSSVNGHVVNLLAVICLDIFTCFITTDCIL